MLILFSASSIFFLFSRGIKATFFLENHSLMSIAQSWQTVSTFILHLKECEFRWKKNTEEMEKELWELLKKCG